MKHIAPYEGHNIHAEPFPGAQSSLCGRLATWKTGRGGVKIPNCYETPAPIDCHDCTKGLELLVRKQAQNLSATGLEKVLEIIGEMRNGQLRG